MPDISMCDNHSCPSKGYCYRYTVKPSEFMQVYANFVVEKGKEKCDYFIDNYKRRKNEVQDINV